MTMHNFFHNMHTVFKNSNMSVHTHYVYPQLKARKSQLFCCTNGYLFVKPFASYGEDGN